MSSLEGGTPLDKGKPDTQLTDWDRRVFESMAKAMWLPNEFKEYMVQYLALNQPPISINQVFGFAGFTFQPATTILTSEATTSTTFVDLATTGPEMFTLPKGRYAIFFGCQSQPTSPSAGIMSVTVTNVAAASDNDSIVLSPGSNMSSSRMILKDLALDGANGIQAKYRSSGGDSCAFQKRWMIAMKYANL